MDWAGASSLDQFWRSSAFPMWLTLAAAGFFALIVLITLLRAEKSVANGALTVITLLAIGIAVAATIHNYGPGSRAASIETQSGRAVSAALPALSCIDDLAGDAVLTACEKVLFGSAESAAAAVSYAALQLTRLTAFGNVAAADQSMSPELRSLRQAIEHDRYGLVAQVLMVRDHCTPAECGAFQSLTDHHQIVANMEEHVYDGLISRYASMWNAPAAVPAPVAMLAPTMPTGRPTNADFPTAASTPPVSIMTPEPAGPASRPAATVATAPSQSSRPTPSTAPALAAARKSSASKSARAPAPVQLTPAAPVTTAPAASND
jgi:hypothetical protein